MSTDDADRLAAELLCAADQALLETFGSHHFVPSVLRRRAAAEALARVLLVLGEHHELAVALRRQLLEIREDTRPFKVVALRRG